MKNEGTRLLLIFIGFALFGWMIAEFLDHKEKQSPDREPTKQNIVVDSIEGREFKQLVDSLRVDTMSAYKFSISDTATMISNYKLHKQYKASGPYYGPSLKFTGSYNTAIGCEALTYTPRYIVHTWQSDTQSDTQSLKTSWKLDADFIKNRIKVVETDSTVEVLLDSISIYKRKIKAISSNDK